jgi:hypothetical protein
MSEVGGRAEVAGALKTSLITKADIRLKCGSNR